MKSGAAVLLLGTALCACGGGDDAAPSAITVGLIAPRGTAAYQPVTASITLAQTLLQEAGGLLGGKRLVFRELDEQNLGTDTTTASAVAACEELAASDIKFVLGPIFSLDAVACAPITGAAGIVQLVPVAASPALTTVADNDFTFGLALRSNIATGAAAQHLYRAEGARRAAVLALDIPDAIDEANGFVRAFEAAGGSTVLHVYNYTPGAFDAQSHLNAVFAAKPDVIFLTGLPNDAVELLSAWQRSAYSGKWLLGAGLLAPAVSTNVGPAKVQGIRVAAQHADIGLPYIVLSQRYQAVNGFSIDQYSAGFNVTMFEATIMMMLAIEAAGSVDDGPALRDALRAVGSPPGTAIDFRSLEEGLALLRGGQEIDFNGISSDMAFDANGDIHTDVDLYVFDSSSDLALRVERTLVNGVDFNL